jgi:hypothetical protein
MMRGILTNKNHDARHLDKKTDMKRLGSKMEYLTYLINVVAEMRY